MVPRVRGQGSGAQSHGGDARAGLTTGDHRHRLRDRAHLVVVGQRLAASKHVETLLAVKRGAVREPVQTSSRIDGDAVHAEE